MMRSQLVITFTLVGLSLSTLSTNELKTSFKPIQADPSQPLGRSLFHQPIRDSFELQPIPVRLIPRGNQLIEGLRKRSPSADPAEGGGNGLTLSITANMDALRSRLLRELMR